MDRALALAVLVTVGLAVLLIHVLGTGRWIDQLRSRLIFGVPWGSLLVISGVLGVYLVLQGGINAWTSPTVLPFRAWSYLYPTGILTAGFAHASPSHLLGNLTAAAVLAPLAEYAWGHYPHSDAGRSVDRTAPLTQIPIVRAIVIFPLATGVIGVFTAAFTVGPVIGFSGVVFAFAGVAVVTYPTATIVGLVSISAIRTLYQAVTDPITIATISPAPPSPPSWVGIAVQGHGIGFILGVLIGLTMLFHRGQRPAIERVFLAVGLYTLTRGLWALYRVADNDTYILYRAGGVVIVIALAMLIAITVQASSRPVPWIGHIEIVPSRRQVGVLILLLVLATAIGPAIPFNLTATPAAPSDAQSLTVADYTVSYEEGIRNQIVPVVELPGLRELTSIETSGVIVTSQQRHLWTRHISPARLATIGEREIVLGGLGWSQRVTVTRTGWQVTGNDTVYAVDLTHDNETVRAFTANQSTATPRIDNRTVTLSTDARDQFVITVNAPTQTSTAPLPATNQTTVVGSLTVRVERVAGTDTVVVSHNGTTVQVARKETYQ